MLLFKIIRDTGISFKRKLPARILQLEDYEVFEAGNAKEGLRRLLHDVVDVI